MTVLKWGTEQLVNTTTTDHQGRSSVTALADGGFIVVWQDFSGLGDDASSSGIKMQRYDAFGDKAGAETLVNTTTSDTQLVPVARTLADGSFIVAWTDASNAGGKGVDVRFRHFAADGTPIDVNDRVAAGFLSTQRTPDIAAGLPGGGYVMAYEDTQSGSSDIFAQRFDAGGALVGSTIIVRSTADNEANATVAAFADGGFGVAWNDFTSGQILFQRYTSAGAVSGGTIVVNNTVGGNAELPDVVVLENGGFLIAWQDTGQPFPDTSGSAIRAQLYNATGVEVGGEFTINTLTAGDQDFPSIVALPDGGFAAVYSSSDEIRGQVFDGVGARVGSEFLVNTSSLGSQLDPSIDVLADGRLVISWTDQRQTGDDTSGDAVRMQIIDPRDGSITGTNSGETLLGNDLVNDEINGLAGGDTLDGLAGADFMYGGDGSDTYFVDNPGDRAIELFGRGTDLVKSSVSFVLPANVEKLTLLPGAANGTGNELANIITGNAAGNVLDGQAGADVLDGSDGNDTLIGGLGADTLTGGPGDDLFRLDDDASDNVSDAGGTDTITSTISRGLAAFTGIDNLTLEGNSAIDGTGNALANTIIGNAAANLLDGQAGADTMLGGGGNDSYVVDNAGDVVSEAGGAGVDTVLSSVAFNLAASPGNVENLTLTGSAAINGSGNTLANVMSGNAAVNVLSGGAGNDTISGGLGNDTILGSTGNDRLAGGLGNDRLTSGAGLDKFVFDTKPGAANRDILVDFNHLQDTFLLDNAVFTKLGGNGALKAGFFHLGAAAADADDHIIYNHATGALIYDVNGSAAGGAVQFATLLNKPALQANDFVVI